MTTPLNKKGSLLIEALLATVIMAVSVTVVIQSFLSGLKATEHSSAFLLSDLILESKLDFMFKKGLDKTTQKFMTETEDSEYQLTFNKQLVDKSNPQDLLNEIELSLSKTEGTHTYQDSIKTWAYELSNGK